MNRYRTAIGPAWINALLLTISLTGCDNEYACDNFWNAQAAFAIAEAELPVDQTPMAATAQQPQTPTIDAQPIERSRRILYFSAKSCPACRVAEGSLDLLTEAGWQVGPGPANHIQTVSIDGTGEEQSLARRLGVNSVPTWIVWDDGRELERRTGVLDPFEIGRLFEEE